MRSALLSGCAALIVGLAIAGRPTVATAASHKVNPGDSIQAAVDMAAPGDTVVVMPGDYTGTGGTAGVRITKPLKLIAKSKLKAVPPVKVRILPGVGQTNGILVEPPNPGDPDVDGLLIKGFTVEGFSNNGIWLRHVQNYKIKGNESIDNLENGIWPTLSANGLVKKNVSYGSQDSALWIEASENVRAIKNDLHHSPTGLEITVSKNIQAKKNDIHHNTVGVGLYHANAAGLPPLGPDDGDWEIVGNHIHDNNEVNTAPPGSLSAALPPGAGILLLGVDRVTIKKNVIENNGFLGVGVLDWCTATLLAGPGSGFDCVSNPPVTDPTPDDTLVTKNELIANGESPPSGFEVFSADLVFISGNNTCFDDNTSTASTFPSTGVPSCN